MNDFILVSTLAPRSIKISLTHEKVPTSRVEETLGVLLHNGYRIVDENGLRRKETAAAGLGLFTQGVTESSKPAPLFRPGEMPTMFRFTTSSTPKNERPRLSVSITGLSPSERDRSRSISSTASTLVSPMTPALSPTSSTFQPLLPISVLPGSFAMVGLTPQSTHSWTSLMIKLFLHPRLLYPSYWEVPDGPPYLTESTDTFAALGLTSGEQTIV